MMICVEEPPRIESLRPGLPPALPKLVHAMLSKAAAHRPSLTAIGRDLACLLARSRVDGSAHTQPVVLPTLAAGPVSRSLTPNVELRVLSALFLGKAGSAEAALESALDALLPGSGARGERLRGGSRILLFDGHLGAGEQALVAARLALALRARVAVPTVVCTGRALVARRGPLGDLVERGAQLLGEAQVDDIVLDEASAALLDARFEIREGAGRRTLVSERLGGEAPRTLLGQVTPFVGRGREIRRLLGLCDEAVEDGAAKVALVVGAAGTGKSRLKYEFVQQLHGSTPELRMLTAQGDATRANCPSACSRRHCTRGLS